MTVEVENAAAEVVPEKRSYIARHWRGELSLAESCSTNKLPVTCLPANGATKILTHACEQAGRT